MQSPVEEDCYEGEACYGGCCDNPCACVLEVGVKVGSQVGVVLVFLVEPEGQEEDGEGL